MSEPPDRSDPTPRSAAGGPPTDPPPVSSPHPSSPNRTKLPASALRFFVRGLAISLPAILTVVIVAWLLRGVNDYVLQPATTAVRYAIGAAADRSEDVDTLRTSAESRGWEFATERRNDGRFALVTKAGEQPKQYVILGRRVVPLADYQSAIEYALPGDEPKSARALYGRIAAEKYFGSYLGLNLVAILAILAALYFLGRFVSARVGSWIVNQIETNVLGRLPVIRNVYGAVKQVTDFLFSESQVEYRRVIALEYPRRGIWSLGLVTGESMLEIAGRAGEPCLSVLIPSSPMPVTGYTINVLRSDVLDLDLSVDQAFQFCISCGVLVPPQQRVTPELLEAMFLKNGHQPTAIESTASGDPAAASSPADPTPAESLS